MIKRPKKARIPFEILNAQEWDPSKAKPGSSSSDDSDGSEDEEHEELEQEQEGEATAHTTVSLNSSPRHHEETKNLATEDQDSFTTVTRKKPGRPNPANTLSIKPARPHNRTFQPPSREGNLRQAGGQFNFKEDSPAQAAFRRRLPPAHSLRLHKPIASIEPNRLRLSGALRAIGSQCKTYIRLPTTPQDQVLDIWGKSAEVTKTVKELGAWIKKVESGPLPTSQKEKFHKEYSTIGHVYKSDQQQIKRHLELQQFQQDPQPGSHFRYSGAYLWPGDEIAPRTIFGNSLEALDELRLHSKCHIVIDSQKQIFRIYSDKRGSVPIVVQRIEGALKAFQAHNLRNGRTTIINVLEPPSVQDLRTHVKVQQVLTPQGNADRRHVPIPAGNMLTSQEQVSRLIEADRMNRANARRVEDSIQNVLPTLIFYHGYLKMRVYFGTFALTDFRRPENKPVFSFDEFLATLSESGTKGVLFQDLYSSLDPIDVVSQICSRSDLFRPIDGLNSSLKDVSTTYGASFDFTRFEMPAIRYEMEMNNHPFEKDQYEMRDARWTRTDQKDKFVPLDIFMVRLGGQQCATSWNFQISTRNILDSSYIDPRMASFVQNLRLVSNASEEIGLSGRKAFGWDTQNTGHMQPSHFEQKSAIRFRLAKSRDLMFEVARYDSYEPSSSDPNRPVRTRWGAQLWNTEWDAMLARNTELRFGESAKWDTRIRSFFPSNDPGLDNDKVDPGVQDFLCQLKETITVLDDVKEQSAGKRARGNV